MKDYLLNPAKVLEVLLPEFDTAIFALELL
jgi:hypothetical protein